ncbi:MAG: hypothetical protein ACE5IF_05185, partial [Candidatus Bathyarchaeia archaeon]
LSESKNVECLSYYTTSIGLIYVVIGLLSGFYLVYLLMTTGSIPSMLVSAHSHFLCMSILILIVGLAMTNWARLIAEKKVTLSGGQLRSAQASVGLLALGDIIAFIAYSAQMPQPGLIGDILYFIGFLMVAVGWILGGMRVK